MFSKDTTSHIHILLLTVYSRDIKSLEVRSMFSCNSFGKHFTMCDAVCNDVSVLIHASASSVNEVWRVEAVLHGHRQRLDFPYNLGLYHPYIVLQWQHIYVVKVAKH